MTIEPKSGRPAIGVPLKVTFFIGGTLLFALLLNMAMSVLTLDRIYSRSLLSQYSVTGRYYVKKIDRALGFGKRLNTFTGMPGLLSDMHEKNPDIHQILILDPAGHRLFSLNGRPDAGVAGPSGPDRKERIEERDGKYHLIFPIHGGRGARRTLEGVMEIVLQASLIRDPVLEMIRRSGRLLVLVGGASVSLFFLVVLWVIPTRKRRHPIFAISLKTRALTLTSLVLILSQIGFSWFSVSDFRERYSEDIRTKCRALGFLVQQDIDYLLGLGIPIHKLIKIDALLHDVLDNIPELSDITVVDAGGRSLYAVRADRTGGPEADPGSAGRHRIVLPVGTETQRAGAVHMNIDPGAVDRTIRDLVFDAGTVVVVSLLVGFEFVFFLVAILIASDRREVRLDQTVMEFQRSTSLGPKIPVRACVRVAAFVYAFSMALSMSFLPIYADALYTPLGGLSRQIVIGLPISAEMLFVAVSLVLGGYWLDRKGWLPPFVAGVLITGAGVGLCGLARDTLDLLLCRSLVGFGYGLALMSTQSVVIHLTRPENRSSAISALEAGYFSGFISSTAVGGMLAEKIGFRSVFFVGAALAFLSIAFVCLFLLNTREAGKAAPAAAPGTGPGGAGLLTLFRDREFAAGLFFSAIPSALALVGFLYFGGLLFLQQQGVGQSNIARLMMPYGLCMVYVAPGLGRWADTVSNKKIPVLLGGLLGGCALISFFFLDSVAVFVVVLVLFSLSGGLSYGARMSAVAESRAVRAVGVGKAMGLFNSMERIGNILAPILVGMMIAAFGMTASISNLGLIYLAGTFLYFVVTGRRRAG